MIFWPEKPHGALDLVLKKEAAAVWAHAHVPGPHAIREPERFFPASEAAAPGSPALGTRDQPWHEVVGGGRWVDPPEWTLPSAGHRSGQSPPGGSSLACPLVGLMGSK